MKVVIKKSLLGIAAILGLGVLVPHALAAETSSQADSDVDLTYIKNDETTKPIDPSEPKDEIEDKPGTGEKGPLSIDYASSISFAKQKVSGAERIYYALPDFVTVKATGVEKEVPNYVQITDNRGTASGWTLQVKQQNALRSASGSELKGAFLTLNNAYASSKNGQVSAASKPSTRSNVDLVVTNTGEGEFSTLMSAKGEKENQVGQGIGTWTAGFLKNADQTEGVQVTVPANLKINQEKYTTTLVWLLSDTPGN